MSACCQSGPAWNTPSAGGVVVVPPGSQAVQIPAVYACHPQEESAMGSVSNGDGSRVLSGPYPLVREDFTAPALETTGGFYSTDALLWAVPGATAWFPNIGHVTLLGVSGALVSYRNVNIPQGTNIRASTPILLGPPSLGVSTSGGSTPIEANALDRLAGLLENQSRVLKGSNEGDLLRWGNNRWTASGGRIYSALAASEIVFNEKWTGGSGEPLSRTDNLALPGLPTPAPSSFGVLLTVELDQEGLGSATQWTQVTLAGQRIAKVYVGNNGMMNTSIVRVTSASPQLVTTRGTNSASYEPTVILTVHGYFL